MKIVMVAVMGMVRMVGGRGKGDADEGDNFRHYMGMVLVIMRTTTISILPASGVLPNLLLVPWLTVVRSVHQSTPPPRGLP